MKNSSYRCLIFNIVKISFMNLEHFDRICSMSTRNQKIQQSTLVGTIHMVVTFHFKAKIVFIMFISKHHQYYFKDIYGIPYFLDYLIWKQLP